MRIIVASPAKTGNVWIKNLLAKTYDLTILRKVPAITPAALAEHIEKGLFPANSIFHQHFRPVKRFFELADSVGAHLVTTIRHPYDVFISQYYYVQNFSELFVPGSQLHFMIGKPIDHPEIIAYLQRTDRGFGDRILQAVNWLESGRSIVTRYEDLVADTPLELERISAQIKPVHAKKIGKAVDASRADKMRRKNRTLATHIRKGTSGDWRNHLTAAHLEAINSAHGQLIERLGYPVFAGVKN